MAYLTKTDMQHYTDLTNDNFSFLKFDQMELFQPVDIWHLKKKDGVEKKLNARDLKLGEHFKKQNLHEVQGGTGAIQDFIDSLKDYTLSDVNNPQRRKISTQILQISADISECLNMLYATCTGEIYII